MPYCELEVAAVRRDTATAIPSLNKLINGLQQNCAEDTGLQTFKIVAGAGPIQLSQGSLAKGRFVLVNVIEDTTNGREPVEIRLNDSTNDAWKGTLFAHEADSTTGITEVWISNPGSNDITVNYWQAGDVV